MTEIRYPRIAGHMICWAKELALDQVSAPDGKYLGSVSIEHRPADQIPRKHEKDL